MISFFNKLVILFLIIILLGCNNSNEIIHDDDFKSNLISSDLEKAKDTKLPLEERKANLEKAYAIYSTLSDGIFKRDKIRDISIVYYGMKDFESFKKMSEKTLKLSTSISDSVGIAKSYTNIGIYYRYSKIDSAYYYFDKADRIYSKILGNEFLHGNVLINKAQILRKAKDYSESEAVTINAIEKFVLAKDETYLPMCYTNLGILAKFLERYDEAIEYHSKSIEYAKGTDEEISQILRSYNNIGTVLKSQKKYDQAKGYYKRALTFKDFLKKRPKRYALLLDNLAYVKFLSEDTKDIPDLFYKSLKIRDSIKDNYGIATNTLHLAEYFQRMGEDSISKMYALQSSKISYELKNNEELLKAYQIMSNVSGNNEGLQYSNKYIKLNDSLIKEERLFRNKFARIRFETEEKEQQIVEKEQQITEVENQNTIYLLGILLLLSGIGFAIYFFRQRTKYLAQQNQIVQFQASYETETRISKRLHDELGNDIFQVMLQYQNDPHDPQIKDKLNTTYHKARDISRENNEFDTDETFTEELSNMLQNYSKNGIQLMVRGLDKIHWDLKEKPVKITVYRVLQELMTNMQKHSKASLVVLVFSNVDQIMLIKYSDNGIGIAKEQLKSKNGLRNTEKRIGAIGGTLIFESEKEKGFKAEIKIPN